MVATFGAVTDGRWRAWTRENEQLLAICGATVLVMAGQGITGPVLPLFAREFGVATSTVGLTITFFALARLIFNLPAGYLGDRYGRRLLLVGGPLVSAVGMTGSGLAVGIGDLLAWRFVAGAGSAFYMTGAQLYVMDISPPDRRGRNMAWNQGALLIGVAVGPAIGGLVAEFIGLRAPFFLVGITAVGAAVYSYFRLEEPPSYLDVGQGEPEAPNWGFLRLPIFWSLCLISFALFASRAGARATLAPLIAYDDLGLSEGEIGGILGVTALITVVLIGPAGQAADRIGHVTTIVPTTVVGAFGVLMIANSTSPTEMTAALAVMAIGTSLAGPAIFALLGDLTTPAQRARAIGFYRSAGDLGFLAAPPIMGYVADEVSTDAALIGNAVLLGGAAIVLMLAAPTLSRRAQPRFAG